MPPDSKVGIIGHCTVSSSCRSGKSYAVIRNELQRGTPPPKCYTTADISSSSPCRSRKQTHTGAGLGHRNPQRTSSPAKQQMHGVRVVCVSRFCSYSPRGAGVVCGQFPSRATAPGPRTLNSLHRDCQMRGSVFECAASRKATHLLDTNRQHRDSKTVFASADGECCVG